MLHVALSVKFRAFGITFGTVNRNLEFPIPFPLPSGILIDFSDKGVKLFVEVL